MDPFAHQQKRAPGSRKLILIALAAGSVSIWYFDLFPELSPVPTGSLEPVSGDGIDEKQFISMLKSTPDENAPAVDVTESTSDAADSPDGDLDSLMTALADQKDPLLDGFPEFAEAPQQEPPIAQDNGVKQASYESPAATTKQHSKPMILSPEVAALLRDADRQIKGGQILEAHAALSRLYWKKPDLRSQFISRIESTAAEIYANPRTHFADPYLVLPGDTLSSIAAKYNVPWQYLARLNRVTAEDLQAGQQLKVLTGPFSAVIDLDEFELTIHAHGWFVRRYKIGIGADGSTPIGNYTVQDKVRNPTWFNPSGGRVDADDPQNPLGEYWLGLGNHIGIHGTIDPESIGAAVSRGCIHLADGDITEVFQLLDVNSPVTIRR